MKIQATSSVIEQITLATGMSYEHLVKALEAELGFWEPGRGQTMVAHKASWDEVKSAVDKASGRHGLVIMNRLDQGTLTSVSGKTKHCVLYLVGNPVIANSILDIDRRGAFYVPFRVCIYADASGANAMVCYDRPSSFLAVLGQPSLDAIGKSLDEKMHQALSAVMSGAN